jgi:CrcB protein
MISLGGAAGSGARYAVGVASPTSGAGFPWGTFFVNVSGSFLIGVVVVLLLERFRSARLARPLLVTGFLGGYTTFSTYAVETDELWRHHDLATGIAYVLGSLTVGLLATVAGIVVARATSRGSGGRHAVRSATGTEVP